MVVSERTRITSVQIRAARAMLNWSVWELSERSGISQSSIHRAERAEGRPSMHEHSLAAIKAALEQYGVEFWTIPACGSCRHQASPGRASSIRHQRKQARKLDRKAITRGGSIAPPDNNRCLFFLYDSAAPVIWNIYCLRIYS